MMGWVKSHSGHYSEAFLYVAGVILVGMATVSLLRLPGRSGS